MRIIAGEHRGRTLLGPADAQTTRPIIDRVKESLFNRLTSLGLLTPDGDNADWSVVDIFSGTGSMGLESLSRGAAHCIFVDQDRQAIERLRQNIQALGLEDRAAVIQGSALAGYWMSSLRPGSIQIAFVDPPYDLMLDETTRQQVLDMLAQLRPILEPGGVAVLRTPREIELPELDVYDGLAAANYGGMRLHFYQTPLDRA